MVTRMAVETQKFIRKPLYVDAVRITGANFDEVVSWCQGEVMQDDVPGRGRSKKYIKIDVHNPKNPRQTKAKVGDWLLKTDKGYKIYTDKAFNESFHTLEADSRNTYVINNFGDTPEAVQLESQRNAGLIAASEEVVPGVTVGEAVRLLRSHADMQAVVGPDVELVPATPEAIMEAARENEAARAADYPETHTIGGTPREDINVGEPFSQGGGGPVDLAEDVNAEVKRQMTPALQKQVGPPLESTEEKIAEAVEPHPGSFGPPPVNPDATIEVEGGIQVSDSDSAPPPVRDGKRVLSVAEQREMDADEIRDLIQSGEVVLAQDVEAA